MSTNLFKNFRSLFFRNSDKNFLLDERDEELLKIAEKVFNKIYKKEIVYLYGFSIDLTYLNKKYGYSIGSKLKSEIFKFLKQCSTLTLFELGGKIIIFTTKQLDRSKISELEKKIVENDRKIIFIEERVIKNIENIEELFVKEIIIEYSFEKIRGKLQKILRGNYLQIEEDLNLIYNILNKNIDSKLKEEILNSSYKELYKKIRKSPLLTKALFFRSKNDKSLFFLYVIAYYLWIEIILIIGNLFKKEKLNSMVDKKKTSFKLEVNENKQLKDLNNFLKDLIMWYQSVIQPFYPFLNKNLKEIAKLIENDIQLLEKCIKTQDLIRFKKIKERLIQRISDFVNNLEIFNLTLPLTNKLKVSENAFNFFRRQLYLIANKNFEEVFKNVFLNYGKKNYPLFLEGKEGLFEKGLVSFISSLFKYNNFDTLYIDSAFLEFDGFNAFNFYLFPNEYDLIYNEILNTFFETANEYVFLKNYKNLKDNKESYQFIIAALGDEFFIFFFSDKKIDNKKVKGFLEDIQKKILEKTKKYIFPKTEKYKITCSKGELIFRRLIFKEKKLFWKNYDDVVLAKLGISGVYLHNVLIINKKELLTNPSSIEKKLTTVKKILEEKMNVVKKKYKGDIKEYDLNFKLFV